MPYLRLTADRRGNEHTFLMHVAGPGEPARVLYWYRTAPGVRLGRPALDDAAMRGLEEQYPEIDFDWHEILESAALTPVEVEAAVPPRKRKPRPAEIESDESEPGANPVPAADPHAADAEPEIDDVAPPVGGDLLADLMGRGIATSVRRRHAELLSAVAAAPATEATRAEWQRQLAAVDPTTWDTPEAVLAGMAAFEPALDAVQRALDAHGGPVAEPATS